MDRSPRVRPLRLVAILVAALPVAFSLIRATSTGSDYRYFWLALASFLGAAAVMVGGRARGRATRALLAMSAVALVVSALLAGMAGYMVGARSGPAIWIVAVAFAFCWVGGFALDALAHTRSGQGAMS